MSDAAPERVRAVVVVAVLAATVLTTASAGVGPLLDPDPVRRVTAAAVLVAVLVAQALALYRCLPTGAASARPTGSLVALALAAVASVPLLAPSGVDQGWETWAWVAAGVAGSAPILVGVRAGAAVAVLLTAAAALVGGWLAADAATYAVLTGVTAVILVLVDLLPVRLWTLVVEARAGRDAAGRLAAAEERLRFAADVHDVLGHHLTVIALAAELAARTTRDAPEAAIEHAERARALAATALVEMRGLVHGYRDVDLPAQLEAVVEVLRASGVRSTLEIDEGSRVPVAGAAALAGVAREAGTNVLRHSRARWCTIELVHTPAHTELTVANDGAAPGSAPDRRSSGLRGLADRVAESGGALNHGLDDGVFTVHAWVPSS